MVKKVERVTDWQKRYNWEKQRTKIAEEMKRKIRKELLKENTICPNCGKKVRRTRQKCQNCGTKITEENKRNIEQIKTHIEIIFFKKLKKEILKAIDFLILNSSKKPIIIKELEEFKNGKEVKQLKIIPLVFYQRNINRHIKIDLDLDEKLEKKSKAIDKEVKKMAKKEKNKKSKKTEKISWIKKLKFFLKRKIITKKRSEEGSNFIEALDKEFIDWEENEKKKNGKK